MTDKQELSQDEATFRSLVLTNAEDIGRDYRLMTREQIDETVHYGFNKRQIRAYIILLEEKDRLVKVSRERVLIEAQINRAEKQEENIDYDLVYFVLETKTKFKYIYKIY
jgi:hypothetical protein